MSTQLQKVFRCDCTSPGDTKGPWINSIVCTERYVIMADEHNDKLKMVDLESPDTVAASLSLDQAPLYLALLKDGLLAVTTGGSRVLYIVRLACEEPSLESRAETDREYHGVAGNSDDTLIVSAVSVLHDRPLIDIISRSGVVLRSFEMKRMQIPWYICASKTGGIFVSDNLDNCVYKLSIGPDGPSKPEQLSYTSLIRPYQVNMDKDENLFVTCEYTNTVLMMTPEGQWQQLLHGHHDSEGKFVWPRCVCVTSSGILVVIWWQLKVGSLLLGYKMTQ